MKHCLIILFVIISISVHAQDFSIIDNIALKKIGEKEYFEAYKKRKKIRLHNHIKGKVKRQIFLNFKKTAFVNKWCEKWGDELEEHTSYSRLPTDTDCNNSAYLLNIEGPIESRTYLVNDECEIDSVEMFCGDSDVELYKMKVYHIASEDFDSDEFVWCKWYLLEYGNIKQIAELKDNSYNYYIPYLEKSPSFFADNKGNFFLITAKKDSNVLNYYMLKILNR